MRQIGYWPFGDSYMKNRAFGLIKPGIVWPLYKLIVTIYSVAARNILGTIKYEISIEQGINKSPMLENAIRMYLRILIALYNRMQ